MLGWCGERLKCSRAALTKNPLRTSRLLAVLHEKPKILIPRAASSPACQGGICQSFRLWKYSESSGEGVRVQKQGRGCRHRIRAAPELPQAPELDPWADEQKNSQLCIARALLCGIAGPTEHRETAQPPLEGIWEHCWALVPCLPFQGEQSTTLLSQLKIKVMESRHGLGWKGPHSSSHSNPLPQDTFQDLSLPSSRPGCSKSHPTFPP